MASDAFIAEKLKDPEWAPYCLVCDTMGRMTKTEYGFRCDGVGDMFRRKGCGNKIDRTMKHYGLTRS
jgi:RecJ-like exonuclease